MIQSRGYRFPRKKKRNHGAGAVPEHPAGNAGSVAASSNGIPFSAAQKRFARQPRYRPAQIFHRHFRPRLFLAPPSGMPASHHSRLPTGALVAQVSKNGGTGPRKPRSATGIRVEGDCALGMRIGNEGGFGADASGLDTSLIVAAVHGSRNMVSKRR